LVHYRRSATAARRRERGVRWASSSSSTCTVRTAPRDRRLARARPADRGGIG
jgi:hypothetical protein